MNGVTDPDRLVEIAKRHDAEFLAASRVTPGCWNADGNVPRSTTTNPRGTVQAAAKKKQLTGSSQEIDVIAF